MRIQRKTPFAPVALRENFLEQVAFEMSFEGKAKVIGQSRKHILRREMDENTERGNEGP